MDRDNACSAAGIIPDANLRAAIEAVLGKASGEPITEADMKRLTRLSAQGAGINNLSGLEHATNLTSLWLYRNNIADIQALSGLTNLTSLWLHRNNIADIQALLGLTNLTSLTLGENNIADIQALSGLTNLTHLWLPSANITDLSALSGLTNMEALTLGNNNIADIQALSGLTNLTSLWLYGNNIADIQALSGLTNLATLYLAFNNVADISAFMGLTNLTELDLRGNNLTDLSALSGLTNLTELDLSQNNVTDLSALSGLTKLTELDLSQNNVTDLSALSGLTNLNWLDLGGNLLNDSSASVHVPVLQSNGVIVRYHASVKGDFDIELVFLDDFTESQERVLEYVVRRWMSVITDDLPDYEFTESKSGRCGDQQFDISAGERIDDLRIYAASFDRGDTGPVAYGGPRLLRESYLPVFGCMEFDLKRVNLLISGLHEVGHVLGFGNGWDDFGFLQDGDGDTHFNGPLAIAAFDEAGGWDYTGKKVPVEGSHWRYSVLPGELMGPGGGLALSAITVQSLADLGYGVDVTQADPYTLPGASANQTSATQVVAMFPTHAEPKLWSGFDGEREPRYVVDQQGRIIRTIGD